MMTGARICGWMLMHRAVCASFPEKEETILHGSYSEFQCLCDSRPLEFHSSSYRAGESAARGLSQGPDIGLSNHMDIWYEQASWYGHAPRYEQASLGDQAWLHGQAIFSGGGSGNPGRVTTFPQRDGGRFSSSRAPLERLSETVGRIGRTGRDSLTRNSDDVIQQTSTNSSRCRESSPSQVIRSTRASRVPASTPSRVPGSKPSTMPGSKPSTMPGSSEGVRLMRRFGRSEIKQLEAAVDKFEDRTVPQGYIETVLGDILRTRNMSSIRQKLLRLREERISRQGFSKLEEDRMRAQSEMYMRHNPNRMWTETAIRCIFPDLLWRHTYISLKSKLDRLRQSILSQSDACSSTLPQDIRPEDTQREAAQQLTVGGIQYEKSHQQSRMKRYTEPELAVLRRAALTDQMPSYEEMRTVLKDRSAMAVGIKVRSLQSAMRHSKPQKAPGGTGSTVS